MLLIISIILGIPLGVGVALYIYVELCLKIPVWETLVELIQPYQAKGLLLHILKIASEKIQPLIIPIPDVLLILIKKGIESRVLIW